MSEVTHPTEPAVAGPTSTSTPWAWLMVSIPVAMAAMDAVVAATVGISAEWQASDFLITLVVFGLSLWLAYRDSEELVRRGLNTAGIWWCALGYPVYLLVRALKARGGDAQRWWMFGLSFCVLMLYIIGGAVLIQPAGLSDADAVEQPLEQSLKAQTGLDVEVTCPDEQPQGVGATFSCAAVAGGQHLTVEVKWTDENGEFQFRLNEPGEAANASPPESATDNKPERVKQTQYKGSGDRILAIRKPGENPKAPMMMTITNSGGSDFVVYTLDQGRRPNDLMVNATGEYLGTVPLDFERGSATTQLQIQSTGRWTVTIKPVTDARYFNQSISGQSDDVIVYDGGAAVANITYNGGGKFIVVYYERVSDQLVNETGRYKGQVEFPAGPAVVTITASDKWSIRMS